MRLEQLYYFEKIYDEKSMARASEKLFVSQPAMSIAISNLEKELGVDLFIRQKKGVVVTEKGEEIIDYVRVALRNIEKIQEVAEQKSYSELRILCIPVLSNTVLPEILSSWKRRNLQVNVYAEELPIASIVTAFQENISDHINYFMFGGFTSQELEALEPWLRKEKVSCIYLGSDETYLFARKEILKDKTSLSIEECKQYLQIFYGVTQDLDSNAAELRKNVLTKRHTVQNYITVDSMILFKQLLKDGVGVTLMPGALFSSDALLEEQNLKRAKVNGWDSIDYYLLYSQREKLELYEEDFVQEVQKYFYQWNLKQQK